jgi:hypothetical protein
MATPNPKYDPAKADAETREHRGNRGAGRKRP